MKNEIDKEMEVLRKYKETLICPICQSDLVSKDYKVNKRSILILTSCTIGGIIIGLLI